MNGQTVLLAKGGGARGGGGARSSGSSGSRSTSSKSTTKSTSTKSTTTSKPRVNTKPSSNTKTTTAKEAKTVAGKTYSKTGHVVDDTYQPRFSGGYAAPAGSTVYYSQGSAWDWFPMYYIMTHGSQREAVVVQPDGKEQVVKEEGVDGMYLFNWFLVIALAIAVIGGVVWFINKKTNE